MSSIVTSILGLSVGLLRNENRDSPAAQLKDDDDTDAKIRTIVVRELSEIISKRDGLSHNDLLSSYRSLKEGICLLIAALDKTKLEQNGSSQEAGQETSTRTSGAQSENLCETFGLRHAMGQLKLILGKELESVKEIFENARKKATDAFCNEALNIEDRIFAAKLRIVSKILESLENPETAILECLAFLQDLHSLPAIREIFFVYLNGGLKSWIGRTKRVENVKSVMMINYVLFHFNSNFSRKLTERVTWPGSKIELPRRSFNPIFDWQEVATKNSMGKDYSQPSNTITLEDKISVLISAVNSHGDLVAVVTENYLRGDEIKVFSKTGENKVVTLAEQTEVEVIDQRIKALAIDHNNNVFIVR